MKFSSATAILSLLSILQPAASRLGVGTTSEFGESSCLAIKDEKQCNKSKDTDGLQCVWCACSAVPSECLNVQDAAKVPAGVFDCAKPPNGTDVTALTAASEEEEEEQEVTMVSMGDSKYDGSLMTYTLEDDEVDKDLCDPKSKSLSGYVSVEGSKYDANGEDKKLFYWFFTKRSSDDESDVETNDEKTPIIMWLTGGPGCSSTLALLTENGPCSVNKDGTATQNNPFSWTENSHMLWIDQPAGVGFSLGATNDYNEEMISEDAYYFLLGFFKKHPEYQSNPLFIVGESYGGHYVPAISHKVWLKNKANDGSVLKINLAGLAVGNGLTNPIVQYQYYPDMVYNNSHGIKVVSEETYNTMKSAVPKCVSLIKKCNSGDSFINKFACQSAFVVCNMAETSPYQMTGLNPYDISKQCGKHPLCYDFSNVEKWLNTAATKKALHVKDETKWATCNMGINLKFHTDWMKDFSPYVADLLNDGIPALIYAGDLDFICNYLGNRAWTLKLDWNHAKEFNAAEEKKWGTGKDGSAAGLARTSNGFTFMQVFNAGHMTPTDQPKVAQDMIKTFIAGGTFE